MGISLRNIDDVLIKKRETFFQTPTAVCETIRRVHSCPVVLGGSGFSIFPEELLALSGADFGIQGAGETSFVSLLAALEAGADPTRIPGLVFRQNGRILANPHEPAAPEAALSGADRPPHLLAHYLRRGGMLNLQTQRGCAFRCCYCTYPVIEGRAHHRRPPEVVADELEALERHGARYAFIVDSVFNSSPTHVAETCEALCRRKLTIRWGCFLRPQGLTPELMQLMARAGLAHIEFGSVVRQK